MGSPTFCAALHELNAIPGKLGRSIEKLLYLVGHCRNLSSVDCRATVNVSIVGGFEVVLGCFRLPLEVHFVEE